MGQGRGEGIWRQRGRAPGAAGSGWLAALVNGRLFQACGLLCS